MTVDDVIEFDIEVRVGGREHSFAYTIPRINAEPIHIKRPAAEVTLGACCEVKDEEQLELQLSVNGHYGSFWVSRNFWLKMAKKAGWTE